MTNFIEEFYYGNIDPQARSFEQNQKVREIFGPKTQKTGLGLAMIAIPKPAFSGFTVFWAVFALKARKLPDLSGRQIRQLLWLRRRDLNPLPSGKRTYHRLLYLLVSCRKPLKTLTFLHTCFSPFNVS